MEIVCRNCGHTFQGEFCGKCGQKIFNRFTGSYLWHGLKSDLFEVDNGLVLTFKELWISPGYMVLNYVEGKRKRYYSPLKYLIFWTAVYLIVTPFTTTYENNYAPQDLIVNNHGLFSIEHFNDFGLLQLQLLQFRTSIYLLGFIPFLAIVNYLVHKKDKFNLTEILILHTYFFGQFAVAAIGVSIIGHFLPSASFMGLRAADLFLLEASYLYLFIRMQKEFFHETWRRAITTTVAINMLGTLGYYFFAFVLFTIAKLTL